ncbi:hypothetical protein L195_g050696 [Trifolium pratense]|uniref:Uncharacterized protein n=1 Tax=Trifolium pratense TaxID=57577 RepID=A0A2K3JVI4_TRIPR|nr:hypothetical protein L195_g050696 [Trifolium pratense]
MISSSLQCPKDKALLPRYTIQSLFTSILLDHISVGVLTCFVGEITYKSVVCCGTRGRQESEYEAFKILGYIYIYPPQDA